MKPRFFLFIVLLLSILLTAGCGGSGSAANAATATLPAATPTDEPTAAPTNTPEPTPIPGSLVYPIESLAQSIPWLPLDEDERPTSSYYGFNVNRPPFNDARVRQAFALAIDRQPIVAMAEKWYFGNAREATTLVPPETLARDLLGEVGLSLDVERARALLADAGYTDLSSFPQVTLLVSTRGEAAPGAYSRIADVIAAMWEENLGIKVDVEVHGDFGNYRRLLGEGDFEIYQLSWGADVNDPDNFMELFTSENEFNFGLFHSEEYDALVAQAAAETDPATRQLLYIQAEQILSEELAGIIPLWHSYFYTR